MPRSLVTRGIRQGGLSDRQRRGPGVGAPLTSRASGKQPLATLLPLGKAAPCTLSARGTGLPAPRRDIHPQKRTNLPLTVNKSEIKPKSDVANKKNK